MTKATWTKEDVELVEKFIDISRRGYYVDSQQLTDAYNRILNRSVGNTSCSQCLKGRVRDLEEALIRFKEQTEQDKERQMKERMAKVRAAKKGKEEK